MTTAIAKAETVGTKTTYAVCDNWDAASQTCLHPAGFEHPTFVFSDTVPPAPLGLGVAKRTLAQWRQDCAREALLLMQARNAPPATPTSVGVLKGFAL